MAELYHRKRRHLSLGILVPAQYAAKGTWIWSQRINIRHYKQQFAWLYFEYKKYFSNLTTLSMVVLRKDLKMSELRGVAWDFGKSLGPLENNPAVGWGLRSLFGLGRRDDIGVRPPADADLIAHRIRSLRLVCISWNSLAQISAAHFWPRLYDAIATVCTQWSYVAPEPASELPRSGNHLHQTLQPEILSKIPPVTDKSGLDQEQHDAKKPRLKALRDIFSGSGNLLDRDASQQDQPNSTKCVTNSQRRIS